PSSETAMARALSRPATRSRQALWQASSGRGGVLSPGISYRSLARALERSAKEQVRTTDDEHPRAGERRAAYLVPFSWTGRTLWQRTIRVLRKVGAAIARSTSAVGTALVRRGRAAPARECARTSSSLHGRREAFLRNYPDGQWTGRERERLTNAIDRVAGNEP